MIAHRFDGERGQPPQHLSNQLLHASVCEYDGMRQSEPHSHIFTELMYVMDGDGWFQMEGELVPVKADDLVLINPQTRHQGMHPGRHGMQVVTLALCCPCFFGPENSRYLMFSPEEDGPVFRPYMQQILRELRQQDDGFEALCQKLADVILILLSRRCQHTKTLAASRKSARECARVRLYIDEHFTEPLTLDQLAEYAGLNKYYLVHVFNREMGCSPISYLIDRRISESRRLLSTTNTSIRQISQDLGFSSPSYFSQSFRRATGFSPAEYRRQTQRSAPAEDAK